VRTEYMDYEPVVQYSEVFGGKVSEEEFITRLSKLDGRQAIATISRLLALHYATTGGDQGAIKINFGLRFCHCYKSVESKGGNATLYQSRKILYSPQTLLLLTKWVLIYCKDTRLLRNIGMDDLLEIMDLSMIVNDLLPLDTDIEGHEIEYLYVTLYHNSHRLLKSQIGRSYYIFSKLMSEIASTKEFIEDFQKNRGYSIEDYFAVLLNLLTQNYPSYDITSFCGKNLMFTVNGFDAKQLKDVSPLVVDYLSEGWASFQEKAKQNLNKQWDFEVFFIKPLIRIQDTVQSISEITLSYHFWEGLYWNIRFLYDNRDIKYLTEFGRPFEQYIQWLARESVVASNGRYTYQNEFLYNSQAGETLSSDAYIKIGQSLIIFEAKAKSPHSKTLKGYDLEQIMLEVEELIVDPVYQVNNRLKEILSLGDRFRESQEKAFFENVDNVIVLSVSMEKVQPIGSLLYAADNLLKCDSSKKRITVGLIKAYHNLNIEDFEAICNLIGQGQDISGILIDWFNGERQKNLTAIPLANYLLNNGYPYTCSDKLQDIFSATTDELYERTFGEKRGEIAWPN